MANFEIRTGKDKIEDIIAALLARAKRLFPDLEIHGELASIDKVIVYRIKHEKALKSGDAWLAILQLTTRWTTKDDNRTIMSLDDMIRIVDRYDAVVDQACALGILKRPDDDVFLSTL